MDPQAGRIEVISGPMFSGKTTHLILRVAQLKAIGQQLRVFRSSVPTHAPSNKLMSRIGLTMDAVPVSTAIEMLEHISPSVDAIALDEAHFFDNSLPLVCSSLAYQGKRVIIAGVDMDFRGEPYEVMALLMAVAERVDKLAALCAVCGGPASFTQRLTDGQPADFSEPVIQAGPEINYSPRCRLHHVVPGRSSTLPSDCDW